ncbi:MAG: hypothetical protein WC208_09440 [Gallionella sp.]|jgi:Tfp pilus assembly protein FimV
MKSEAQRCKKILFQLWTFSLAAVFMVNASALVLGDIQVNSALGQSLSARIALIAISDEELLELKTGLASAEVYKKFGLQYPDVHKFRFQLVNDAGAPPFIRVSTLHPVEDPFINLLLEISTASGKLTRAYTLLLDPPSDLLRSSAVVQSAALHDVSPQSMPASVSGKHAHEQSVRPVKTASKRKKHHANKAAQTEHATDRSHMKLAMSLSISRYDASVPVGPKEANDALQEELIAKEKLLEDLNLQIGEMKTVIKSLQDKRALASSSAVPEAALAASEVHSAELPEPVVLSAQPPGTTSEINWLNSVLAFAVLLLGLVGVVWYRKYKQMHEGGQGTFDDLHEAEPFVAQMIVREPVYIKPEAPDITMPFPTKKAPFTSLAESSDTQLTQENQTPTEPGETELHFEKVVVPVGEQSIETPAYAEHAPIVPPEYAILMAANRHLRAGNDQLAEEALIQAIKVNPKNLYGYQALLRIYDARTDAKSFEGIALQLKETGDEAAFKEAAAMGQKLDPDNPLYL